MDIVGSIGDAVSGAVDSVTGGIFKCVTSIVGEIVGQLGQQQNMLNDLVRTPIQGMIDEVTGGIWTGPGADAFVAESQSVFLSSAQQVTDGIGDISGRINTAVDLVEEADKKATNLVHDLAEEFGNIFKG
jgi:uncharacterized protein YukE